MPDITITVTDEEMKALEYVAVDVTEWVSNFTKNRAAAAMREIYDAEVRRMIDDPDIHTIPADPYEVVRNADLPSAAERHEEFLANQPATMEMTMHGDPEVDPPKTPVPPKPEPAPTEPEPDEDDDEDDDVPGQNDERIA